MKYCRFETDAGPQYGRVEDRAGTLWIESLLPPFEEDPWSKLASQPMEPVPMASVASNWEKPHLPSARRALTITSALPGLAIALLDGSGISRHSVQLG